MLSQTRKPIVDVRIPKLISTLKTILDKYNLQYVSFTNEDQLIRELNRTGYGNINYTIRAKHKPSNDEIVIFNHTFQFKEFGGCCGAAVMIGIDNLVQNNNNFGIRGISIQDQVTIVKLIFSYIFSQLRKKAKYFIDNNLSNGLGVVSLHLNTTNTHVRELLLTMEGEVTEYLVGTNPKTQRTIYFFCTNPHLN